MNCIPIRQAADSLSQSKCSEAWREMYEADLRPAGGLGIQQNIRAGLPGWRGYF